MKSTHAKPAHVALPPVVLPTATPPQQEPQEVPSVVGAAVAELAAANALHTAAGLAAVQLARLIDGATLVNGSSPAAWVREMRAALADAKSEAPAQDVDPLDELEKRRAARGA